MTETAPQKPLNILFAFDDVDLENSSEENLRKIKEIIYNYNYYYNYYYLTGWREKMLNLSAKIGVDVLKKMKSPGCKWLHLVK